MTDEQDPRLPLDTLDLRYKICSAGKRHYCKTCQRRMEIGDEHICLRARDDGQWTTFRYHVGCLSEKHFISQQVH